MVIDEDVVWMSDPEASWGLISIQKTPGSLSLNDQIVFDVVVSLNGIFNEDGVTFNFISNVVFKSQVMSSVKCESSVITLMSSESLGV